MQTDSTLVRNKIACTLPFIFQSFSKYETDNQALTELALHIQSRCWTEDDNWPAPLNYERFYHNVPDKLSWLKTVEELLDIVNVHFIDLKSCAKIFDSTNLWQRTHLHEEILNRCHQGTERIRTWLTSKYKPAIRQFTEAIKKFKLYNNPIFWDSCSDTEQVLHLYTNRAEMECLDLLLDALEGEIQMGITPQATQVLAHTLAGIKKFAVQELITRQQEQITANFRQLDFPREYTQFLWEGWNNSFRYFFTDPPFWSYLIDSINLRVRYAQRAYDLLILVEGKGSGITVQQPLPAQKSAKSLALDNNPFSEILLNYTIEELTALLRELRLIDSENRESTTASPGAWAGVICALCEAKPQRLQENRSAIRRAFNAVFGSKISERTAQAKFGKTSSRFECAKDEAIKLLRP